MKQIRDTKQEIINTSIKLFYSKGYAGTSMNDIISTVGISKGSVYWHFKSKEEIFVQVIAETYNEWINLVNAELENIPNPIEKLRKYGQLFVDTVDIPSWNLSPETYWNEFSEKSQSLLDEYFSLDDKIILQIFQEAQQQGLLKSNENPETLMWIYISSLEGMFEKIIIAHKNNDPALSQMKQNAITGISLFLNSIIK